MADLLTQLNARSREVLRLVVDTYVETGEPVGSRTLARKLGTDLSPATVRNVMADLQDAGLLYAPHTSAGRLPTELGLRLFVDGLLEVGRLTDEERRDIEAKFAGTGRSVQQSLEEATRMLSGLANCAGLVFAPKREGRLRHIEFVALGPGRALVVLVLDDGQVENRVIELPLGLPMAALVEATNFLSSRMVGRTIDEARQQLAGELEQHRRDLDELTARLVSQGLATEGGDRREPVLIVAGTGRLLDDIHAVEDLERVRGLFALLDKKEGLSRLLDATLRGAGVQVYIGAENELFGLAGCSMIVAPYANREEKIVGAVGVIGPTRLNYARIVPVVDYTARVIGRMID